MCTLAVATTTFESVFFLMLLWKSLSFVPTQSALTSYLQFCSVFFFHVVKVMSIVLTTEIMHFPMFLIHFLLISHPPHIFVVSHLLSHPPSFPHRLHTSFYSSICPLIFPFSFLKWGMHLNFPWSS